MHSPKRYVVASLGIAILAAFAAASIHMPLPWMLGPLLSVALLRLAGVRLAPPNGGRKAGQWVVGNALGLYFTPPVVASLFDNAPVIIAVALSSVVFGLIGAQLIQRWAHVSPATAFFASLPGGASEMVVLAQRQNAALDSIVAAHVLRVMVVVSVIPFVLHYGASGQDATVTSQASAINWARLPLLLAASVMGASLFAWLRISNPWMLGPLAIIGSISAAGLSLGGLPPWLINGGQLLLGVALGCCFSPAFFRRAPRFLSISALATCLTLALCGLVALIFGAVLSMSVPSLLLAASPGGMAEMSITAREMDLDVPLVTATHVLRVVLLTVIAPLAWNAYQRLVLRLPPRGPDNPAQERDSEPPAAK